MEGWLAGALNVTRQDINSLLVSGTFPPNMCLNDLLPILVQRQQFLYLHVCFQHFFPTDINICCFLIGERINNQNRRRWRRESKKIIGIFSKIISPFLLHFFNIQCKTTCTTWNVLTRRFMENGNCRKIGLHLPNWPKLKKCDKVLIVVPLRFADRNRLGYFWGAEEGNRDKGGVTFPHSLPNLVRRFPLVFSYLCSIRAALSYLNT